jgi:hypothetical protein
MYTVCGAQDNCICVCMCMLIDWATRQSHELFCLPFSVMALIEAGW